MRVPVPVSTVAPRIRVGGLDSGSYVEAKGRATSPRVGRTGGGRCLRLGRNWRLGRGLRLRGTGRRRSGRGRQDDVLSRKLTPAILLQSRDPAHDPPQQVIFLAIVAVTLILFISEKIRIDIAAMLTLLALAATGILTQAKLCPASSSEPALIVAAVFVISGGLTETGLTDRIGAVIGRAAGAGNGARSSS